ncbi:hypothetical protein EDD21DRAFT_689 [Dissophora ornata]|nr:hypothetical protein EDD21DRAFT_689 [Dissophora ornata]
MAQQGSRGLSQQPRQDQGPQRQGQAQQGQGLAQQDQPQIRRPPTRSFHNAAWNFDELVQEASPGLVQAQNQHKPGALAQRTGQGLRRGFGDFANSSSQRNSHAMVPPPPGSNFGGAGGIVARTGTSIAPSTPVDPPGNMNQDSFTGVTADDQHQSLGFSQAFALGVSIPTSKFNTEAFGTLSVRPAYNATSNTAPTGTNLNTSTATATVLYDPDAIESLDDDLELPGDFDDEFEAIGMDTSKEIHGLGAETAMSQTGPIFGDIHPPTTQSRSDRADDIQSVDEVAFLKQKMAEMEAILKEKEEELLIKSGQASIFKEKLEDESRAHTELREKFRSADLKHQSEKEALEEKHRKDLANANMNHQFEVQKYILDGPSGSKTSKLTQLPRHPTTQPPVSQFPKAFAGFASTQSSIKAQPRSDDGFSIHNFAVPPKSPRKSRSFGVNGVALEKPRPLQITGEPVRTVKPVFGFSSNIPTHSIEEITRGKLLAGHENSFGLRHLSTIEADEERYSPLPGLHCCHSRRICGVSEKPTPGRHYEDVYSRTGESYARCQSSLQIRSPQDDNRSPTG